MKEAVPEKVQEAIFERLLGSPDNRICADCSTKGPRWVSIDFGVFICMNCAGHHRNLGPSITRVRSVKLDSWRQELIDIMENVGNKKANGWFEFNLPASRKPDSSWTPHDVRRFIQEKYVKRLYANVKAADPVSAYLGKPNSKSLTNVVGGFAEHTSKQPAQKPTPNTKQTPGKAVNWDSFGFDDWKAPVAAQGTPQKNTPTQKTPVQSHNLLDFDDFATSKPTGGDVSKSPFESNASSQFATFQTAPGIPPVNESPPPVASFHSSNTIAFPQQHKPHNVSHFLHSAHQNESQFHTHAPQKQPAGGVNLLSLYDQVNVQQPPPLAKVSSEEKKAVARGNYQFLESMGSFQPQQMTGGPFTNFGAPPANQQNTSGGFGFGQTNAGNNFAQNKASDVFASFGANQGHHGGGFGNFANGPNFSSK